MCGRNWKKQGHSGFFRVFLGRSFLVGRLLCHCSAGNLFLGENRISFIIINVIRVSAGFLVLAFKARLTSMCDSRCSNTNVAHLLTTPRFTLTKCLSQQVQLLHHINPASATTLDLTRQHCMLFRVDTPCKQVGRLCIHGSTKDKPARLSHRNL